MAGKTAVAPKFLGDGKVVFEERRVPSPNQGELLLAVGVNAIRGTDRPQYFGGSGVAPGHEAAGVVVETRAGTRAKEGTPGVVFYGLLWRVQKLSPRLYQPMPGQAGGYGFYSRWGLWALRGGAREQFLSH